MSRRSMMILGGVCVALLLVWFQFLWSPKGAELSKAQDRVQAAENDAQQLEVQLARLQSAQKDAPRLLATAERLHQAVPEAPDLAEFLLDANDAATKSGVDFLSITPTPPAPSTTAGAPSEVRLAVQIKGGYFQLLDYLDRLLSLPRVVVLDSIQVSPADAAAGEPVLSVSLSGRIFTTWSEAPPTATTVPGTPATPGTPTTTSTTVAPSAVASAPTPPAGGAS